MSGYMEALFNIGQKVVCVDSKDYAPHIKGESPPLIEGKTYTNHENDICDCGLVNIDVGLPVKGPGFSRCRCGRKKYITKWFVDQTRFVPLDDDRAMDDEIRESLNLHLIER